MLTESFTINNYGLKQEFSFPNIRQNKKKTSNESKCIATTSRLFYPKKIKNVKITFYI